jgi:hypothetical protein
LNTENQEKILSAAKSSLTLDEAVSGYLETENLKLSIFSLPLWEKEVGKLLQVNVATCKWLTQIKRAFKSHQHKFNLSLTSPTVFMSIQAVLLGF